MSRNPIRMMRSKIRCPSGPTKRYRWSSCQSMLIVLQRWVQTSHHVALNSHWDWIVSWCQSSFDLLTSPKLGSGNLQQPFKTASKHLEIKKQIEHGGIDLCQGGVTTNLIQHRALTRHLGPNLWQLWWHKLIAGHRGFRITAPMNRGHRNAAAKIWFYSDFVWWNLFWSG